VSQYHVSVQYKSWVQSQQRYFLLFGYDYNTSLVLFLTRISETLEDYDACSKYNNNCSTCTILNCLYCSATGTCSRNRISSDCLCKFQPVTPFYLEANYNGKATCGDGAVILPAPVAGDHSVGTSDIIVQVVPAVVVGSAVLVAGVVVLVVLLRRKRKRKPEKGIRMSVKNSMNTSKYGIERNALGKIEYKAWEPIADSE
jgi:hypothetical protein